MFKSRTTACLLAVTLAAGCFLLCIVSDSTALRVSAEPADAGTRDFPIKNGIDKAVLSRLQEEKIEPSGLCTDEEFLRRASLDLLGIIPTKEEVKKFLADRSVDKRAKMVDALLLKNDRYADHWSVMWSDLLREHSNSKPKEGTERGSYKQWISEALEKNMPYDQFARELITAKGNPEEHPEVNFYLRDEMNRVETSNTISTAFMGTRMACAQCHDHPFDKWTQTDFHGLMAFFGRTAVVPNPILTMLKVETDKRLPEEARKLMEPYFKEAHEAAEKAKLKGDLGGGGGGEGMGMMMGGMMMMGKGRELLKELDTDKTLTKEQNQRVKNVLQQNQVRQVVERPQGEYRMPADGEAANPKKKNGGDLVQPAFPWDASKKVAGGSRRDALADMITGSRQFAAVQVNRIWSRVMGRGIVDPIDDFREKNPPSNPELLDYLTDQFVAAKFDNQQLLRLIVNSSTYQRSSMPNSSNKSDTTLYSHQKIRRMSAEQIFDSILVATGHEHGMNLNVKEMIAKNETAKKYLRTDDIKTPNIQWANDLPTPARTGTFMNEFNQPDREQIVVKRDDAGSISQALELINGRDVSRAINNSPLTRQLLETKAAPSQIISELYTAVLSRYPTSEEARFCMMMMRSGNPNKEWLEDMHWALINTREFGFIK